MLFSAREMLRECGCISTVCQLLDQSDYAPSHVFLLGLLKSLMTNSMWVIPQCGSLWTYVAVKVLFEFQRYFSWFIKHKPLSISISISIHVLKSDIKTITKGIEYCIEKKYYYNYERHCVPCWNKILRPWKTWECCIEINY